MNNLAEEKRLRSSLGYVNEQTVKEERRYLLRIAGTTPKAFGRRTQYKGLEVQ
jgi:hypothetical protein